VAAEKATEFLSTAWFEQLSTTLEGLELEGPALVIGQVVTGVPARAEADVEYSIRLGGGREAAVVPDSVATADIVLVVAYRDALALATGAATVGSLLGEGGVKIRGDAARLVEAGALLEAAATATTGRHRIVT